MDIFYSSRFGWYSKYSWLEIGNEEWLFESKNYIKGGGGIYGLLWINDL